VTDTWHSCATTEMVLQFRLQFPHQGKSDGIRTGMVPLSLVGSGLMAKHDGHATLLTAYLDEVCNRLERRRQAPAFRQWQKAWLGVPLAAGLSLAATQCGGTSTRPTEECTGDTCAQLCSDEIDNDADGAVDCDDPDCSAVCVSGTLYGVPIAENCSDGEDDDGDGDVDCDDSDCADDATCSGGGGAGGSGAGPVYSAPLEDCTNGVDDDGDGLVDCGDPDCDTDAACVGPVPIYASPLYAAPIP
jgi:hypothetical protein